LNSNAIKASKMWEHDEVRGFAKAQSEHGGRRATLVTLSVFLTESVLFPDISEQWIVGNLIGGSVVTALAKLYERSAFNSASATFWVPEPVQATVLQQAGASTRSWNEV